MNEYTLVINDAATFSLRLLLRLIREALLQTDSDLQTLEMEIILSIHGNGFAPFINFLHQMANVILPQRANAIHFTIEEWFQDNSYHFGVFNVLNMACIIGQKRTICIRALRRYEFVTINI